MKNVYIYCEGPTEEAFINGILSPYFCNIGIYVYPIICKTKRTKDRKYKGGVSDYFKIKDELTLLCKQHNNEKITTMFDYYGMPSNTPNINNKESNIYIRIKEIEKSIEDDIGMSNLFFGIILHEFEALLFSNPDAFSIVANRDVVFEVRKARDDYATPEHINNSPETSPSKRLEKMIPNYPKVKNGLLISKEIGIDKIILECKNFANWIETIKNC